jgi:hypothetical protein
LIASAYQSQKSSKVRLYRAFADAAKSNRTQSSSTSSLTASSRARIQRSSRDCGRSSGSTPSVFVRMRRATFQSFVTSFRPSSTAPYEKRTSCVEDIFSSP